MNSVLTTVRADMCYCPGCSHGVLLEKVGRAIDQLGVPLERVCLVSDIGCIGTADRYFACHTFHGLHGRAITYAEGIKRARPELTVVVLVGDGGCGIGTAHLVHAARRGAGIKVIVANNFNFGMTGGQHSPTTPTEAVTSTTPGGAGDRPFDLCATVLAAGGDFVGRCSVMSPAADEMVAAALRSRGFAFVDCWELCTAYFVAENKLSPKTMDELSGRMEMPFGVLRDREPQAAGRAVVERASATREALAPCVPRLPWARRGEICVAGSAGQRVRSAAGAIGEIAVAGGLYAAQQDDFPITVRRGHSISNLIVSREPILFTGIDAPELVVLLSEDGLRRVGGAEWLRGCGQVIADGRMAAHLSAERTRLVDCEALGRKAGRAAVGLVLLARGILDMGWTTAEALRGAAEAALGGAYREANLQAIEAAIALGPGNPPRPGFRVPAITRRMS